MKTLTIYTRTILQKTGYRNKMYAYKQEKQFIVYYDNQEYKNHNQSIDNTKLKVPFKMVLQTRSLKKINEYKNELRKNYEDQKLKETIENILRKEN